MMRRVVVGVDGTAPAGPALLRAAIEAGRRGARLDVVAAWTYPPLSAEEKRVTTAHQVEAEARALATEQVEEILEDPSLGDLEVDTSVALGAPAKLLLAAAEGADLLVVGRRDDARLRHLVLGSVADQCIRHAPCPTMVVPHPDDDESDDGGPLIVGVDGSHTSREALAWALEEAALLGCGVRAVHCWQQPFALTPESATAILDPAVMEADARRDLDRWLADADVPAGVELQGVVRSGDPTAGLLEDAGSSSLIVVGSRGRGGFVGLLLGSVGRRVVHLSPCPVVVFPHDHAGAL